MLNGLELPDGSTELDPDLCVFRGCLEAPAGQPRTFGRHQHQSEITHIVLGEIAQVSHLGQGKVADGDFTERPGGVEGHQILDGDVPSWFDETPGAIGQGSQDEPCGRRTEHGAQRAADPSVRIAAERARTQGKRARCAAVGQPGR